MAAINEDLILSVFEEMVKSRPSLSKYIPSGDEDDEVDYRIIADLVIKNFPWPIGVELRRLFSGSMRQPGRLRLDQIFKTIERTIQFLSFVMVCQAWYDISKKKITLPDSDLLFIFFDCQEDKVKQKHYNEHCNYLTLPYQIIGIDDYHYSCNAH